jgi:hypothetical protein
VRHRAMEYFDTGTGDHPAVDRVSSGRFRMDEGTPGAIVALVQGAVAHVMSRNAGGVYKPWISEFSYTYIVNGEYFPGFHRIRGRSRKRADGVNLGWKNRMLVARYSSSSHETSVLLKSDQPEGQLGN